MHFSYKLREFSFFAIVAFSFIIGSVIGMAIFSCGPHDVFSFNYSFDNDISIGSLIFSLLLFPLAVFFLGFSAFGTIFIPAISVIRGISASLTACCCLSFFGISRNYFFLIITSSISCIVYLFVAYFALQSSCYLTQNVISPGSRSDGFGNYIARSVVCFAALILAGFAEFCIFPYIL